MHRTRFTRLAALTLAATSVAVSSAVMAASPAQARPIECSLYTYISKESQQLYARAEVNCPQMEHYSISLQIFREDFFGPTPVASEYKGTYHSGYDYVGTSEPCSDVQTNKKYHALAVLYDTTYIKPIDVKDHESPSVQGHC